MVRGGCSILTALCFLASYSGAALDAHLHESSPQHSTGHCAVCGYLAHHSSAVVGEMVSWSAGFDHRPEHAPLVVAIAPSAAAHHEPAEPRAPPTC
jgi:hypothetical protein